MYLPTILAFYDNVFTNSVGIFSLNGLTEMRIEGIVRWWFELKMYLGDHLGDMWLGQADQLGE